MTVRCEAIAAESLRSWLLLKLPAKVVAVNAARAAALTSPWAGTYNIPAGAVLNVGTAMGTYSAKPLTAGSSRTAAQLVTDIGALASVDSEGRLALTSPTPPTTGTPSVMAVGPDTAGVDGDGNPASTGANIALGFGDGGEHVVRSAIAAPTYRAVMDGWPMSPDFPKGLSVVIGDRASMQVLPIHRHESIVTLDVSLLHQDPNQARHRTRESIEACVQCVREVLFTDSGRTLGQPKLIIIVEDRGCSISGLPVKFGPPDKVGPLYDVAVMTLAVKVYEVPTA